jgi:hypothetical protein
MLEYTVWQRGPPFSITVHARALDMQCIPCDQALSGMPGPRGLQLKMQITKYALSAFAWMVRCMMHGPG